MSDTRWSLNDPWHWVESQPGPVPRPEDVPLLKPAESHNLTVDFLDSAWFLVNTKEKEATASRRWLVELQDERTARFRFEYRPPPEACRGLPNEKLIWRGRPRPRAFSPTAGLD